MKTEVKEVMGYTKATVDNILIPRVLDNPHKELIVMCENKCDNWKTSSYYNQFRHLLEILGEEDTNQWINGNIAWLSDKDCCNVNSLYFTMHKSIRQGDLFDGKQGGHMDMILYALMGMGDYIFELLKEVLVDTDNIKKWEVVTKELAN